MLRVIDENEIVSYIVINKELDMSTGKIGVQVGHACVILTMEYPHDELFNEWYGSRIQKKILLEGQQKSLVKLIEQGFKPVYDIGCNEVPPNSLTAVALPPMKRKDAYPFIKRLQALKDRKTKE